MSQTWNGWEADVLAAAGYPTSSENETFLQEWHAYEGSGAQNNPLNTTLRTSTSTTFNSAGVQNYPTPAAGALATARTLKGPYYPNLQAALREGNPFTYADPQALASEITTWGTPNFAASFLAGTTGSRTGSQPGTVAPSASGVTGPQASGHKGYQDLRWSLASHLPNQLRASARTGLATSRTLAARRKVGGGR